MAPDKADATSGLAVDAVLAFALPEAVAVVAEGRRRSMQMETWAECWTPRVEAFKALLPAWALPYLRLPPVTIVPETERFGVPVVAALVVEAPGLAPIAVWVKLEDGAVRVRFLAARAKLFHDLALGEWVTFWSWNECVTNSEFTPVWPASGVRGVAGATGEEATDWAVAVFRAHEEFLAMSALKEKAAQENAGDGAVEL